MKKSLLNLIPLFIAVAFLAPGFNGCKKYEEGPSLTFKSAKSRLANVWKVEKSFLNGVEETCDADCQTERNNTSIEFKKDGTFILVSYFGGASLTYTGTWTLSSDKNVITTTVSYTLLGQTYTDTDVYTILRLTSKECWVEEKNGADVEETHFITAS
ncbi:MAG: hypothetical protein HYY40_04500 [Bacteroidetes bacterium]|nr:hypothetical protein [Bacteroidota bacterium]